jgi:uncharacterized membrane protein (UPF0127 family)
MDHSVARCSYAGMLFALDLIFLDRNKVVVHLEECVRPFRVSRVILKTHSVLEVPQHTIARSGTRIGDQIEISRIVHVARPLPDRAFSPYIEPSQKGDA